MDLVDALRGDVGGRYAGPVDALDLDAIQPGHLSSLATAHGLNLSQFGIYG